MTAGRTLLRAYSEEPVIRAHVLVLPPGHVYRAVVLTFGTAGRDALAKTIGAEEIDSLLAQAEEELREPELWCTSLVLVPGIRPVAVATEILPPEAQLQTSVLAICWRSRQP